MSADSVQVYFGMDIGSAKPSLEERQGIPHHLIDCVPIDTPEFSVSQYRDTREGSDNRDLLARECSNCRRRKRVVSQRADLPAGICHSQERRSALAKLSDAYDENPQAAYQRLT